MKAATSWVLRYLRVVVVMVERWEYGDWFILLASTFRFDLWPLLTLIRERHLTMSMKLYVGNLAFQTTERDLENLFSQVGTVESASIMTDRDSGRSRGFGFVEMSSKAEGEAVISRFNGAEIDGRSLTVNEAKPRENRQGAGGGGRGGFGGGGRSSFGGNRGGGRSRY